MKYLIKARNIGLAFTAILAWSLFLEGIAALLNHYTGATGSPFTGRGGTQFGPFVYNIPTRFLFTCVVAPLWEEAAYRWAPLTIGRSFDDVLLRPIQWPIIIVSSAFFGYSHDMPYGLVMHGVTGVILSYLMIKNNYDYWSNVITHSGWNLFCLSFLI